MIVKILNMTKMGGKMDTNVNKKATIKAIVDNTISRNNLIGTIQMALLIIKTIAIQTMTSITMVETIQITHGKEIFEGEIKDDMVALNLVAQAFNKMEAIIDMVEMMNMAEIGKIEEDKGNRNMVMVPTLIKVTHHAIRINLLSMAQMIKLDKHIVALILQEVLL